jgi:phospholipid/cholesterol/gamma-HCH transport system ATP-binding protein
MGMIEVRNLRKSFDGVSVLRGVNLSVEKGTTAVILGRSGSGKSVFLRCVIGLLTPDAGSIQVGGQEVVGMELEGLMALRRRMGFLFQSSALFDSKSVYDNLAFPLRRSGTLAEDEIQHRVAEELQRVGLKDCSNKMPSELSGGMRKRIGLARSMITTPEFMLYDEPTTGLDPGTAREISALIRDLEKHFRTTSIAVTHDMECARTIADRVAILNDGIVRFEGSIETLEHSDDHLVQSFFSAP